MTEAFAGIDVAFAKRKRLPVFLCVRESERLRPLPLRSKNLPKPPAGKGNRAALDKGNVKGFAIETLGYLRLLERQLNPVRPSAVGEDRKRAHDSAMAPSPPVPPVRRRR